MKYLYCALLLVLLSCSEKENVFNCKIKHAKIVNSFSLNGKQFELKSNAPVGITNIFTSDTIIILKTSNPEQLQQIHIYDYRLGRQL